MNTFYRLIVYTLFLGLIFFLYPAHAAEELTLFELEGNAIDDTTTPVPGDDWDTVLLGGGGNSQANTGVVVDDPGATIFTQGGSKDTRDIPYWRWKNGSVPDKDDVTNAYAAAYVNSSDELLIYVGADRFANNGDAVMSLWLFQDAVSLNDDGTFEGHHIPGDLLAVAEFANGGQDVNIVVYEWVGVSNGKGILQEFTNFPAGVSTKCGAGSFYIGCAITNEADETAPWSYTPKAGTPGVFPPVSFFEGVFNISQIATELGFEIPCFSSFMVQSRSSTSLTAQLKDFVLGEFETCKLEVTKNCNRGAVNATETAFLYGYSGTVTNSGFGTLYDIIVVDDNGTPGNTADDTTHTIGNLAAGADQTYSGTFESSENPPTNTVVAYGRSSETAAERSVESDPVSDECPPVDRDPNISITKRCSAALDDSSGSVLVKVNFGGMVCNTGNIGLNNIRVFDAEPNVVFTDPIASSLTKAGTTNECDGYRGYYYPTTAGRTYSNTITVKADANLGFGTDIEPEEPATATCPLCP